MPKARRPVRPWGPGWLRAIAFVLGVLYPSLILLDELSTRTAYDLVPHPVLYFAQVAALFPHASVYTIEFRAEGWSCKDHQFREIDVRPYFPIQRNDKENQFGRALFFYLRNRLVMRALDSYVTSRFNHDHAAVRIGGVRFLSLREPIPKPGTVFPRFVRRPLSAYPEAERHYWYWTPLSMRRERCGEAAE